MLAFYINMLDSNKDSEYTSFTDRLGFDNTISNSSANLVARFKVLYT